MAAFESLSSSQKIRAAVHRDVRAICTETLHFLGLEMTKSAMDLTAELVYKKLTAYGGDLEAFAKHGKRNVINGEDVKLLVRRNPSLKAHLNKIVPSNPPATKDKRRKTKDTPAKTNDDPKMSDDPNKNKDDIRSSTDLRTDANSKSNKEKEGELFDEQDDFDINMIVDDTIDLTFD